MELRYHLLDVFTDRPFGGNQLAVFTEPPSLETELMQRIARELNLSESVFVFPAKDPSCLRRLRIFTPAAELPFAGHPTVGTAYLLADLGVAPGADLMLRFSLEEGIGPVPVTVRREPGASPFVELTAAKPPEVGPAPPEVGEIAAMLGLTETDIGADGYDPAAVSAGVPFLIVPIRSRAAIGRARLDQGRWERLLAKSWAPQVYLFSREPETPGADFRVRMFSPALGVPEDPATGAAAAAFAGYLGSRSSMRDGTTQWKLEQGMEMGRPSFLTIQASKVAGAIESVRVGGTAVRMGEGVIRLKSDG